MRNASTILIKDTSYFTEPVLAVKEGGRYVLPIYEYGDSVWGMNMRVAILREKPPIVRFLCKANDNFARECFGVKEKLAFDGGI